jgi:hypothetical protein
MDRDANCPVLVSHRSIRFPSLPVPSRPVPTAPVPPCAMFLRRLRTSAALRRGATDGGVLAALRTELAGEFSFSGVPLPPPFHCQVTPSHPPSHIPNPNSAPHSHSHTFAPHSRRTHLTSSPYRTPRLLRTCSCAAGPTPRRS